MTDANVPQTDWQQEVKRVVQDFIDGDKMFTAFDVTRKLRADHINEAVYHRTVRPLVTDMYNSGQMPSDYTRTAVHITLPNGNVESAVVFHANSQDPQQYDAQSNDPAGPDPFDPNAVASATPSKSLASAIGTLRKPVRVWTDNRGRVAVPKEMLEIIGATPGKRCGVAVEQSSIRVSTLSRSPATRFKMYKVDKSGNIRIGRSTQLKAGMYTNTKYQVSGVSYSGTGLEIAVLGPDTLEIRS